MVYGALLHILFHHILRNPVRQRGNSIIVTLEMMALKPKDSTYE